MALPDLVQVDCDDARLGRLLQLYIHEWSARLPVPIGADALFAYPGLAAYRDRASHRAFLFVDRVPLGFALVVRGEAGAWEVEEFFVVAGARRRGLGATAARRIFAEFPGPWTFTVRPENPEGLGFWRRLLAGNAAERVEVGGDGVARTRFSFVAGGNP